MSEDDKDFAEDMEHIFSVIATAHEECPDGGSGTTPCPKCGATLHYSVAACNGHVWGKCETDGCLAWMQ